MAEQQFHRDVLLDTGPLVAILSQQDRYHDICVSTLARIQPPLLTCWPVLTEAAWLLRNYPDAVQRLLRAPNSGLFEIVPLGHEDLSGIGKVFKRYETLRPQLADVALVHLAIRESWDTVFTLDRRDFTVYRRKGRQGFQLLPESLA